MELSLAAEGAPVFAVMGVGVLVVGRALVEAMERLEYLLGPCLVEQASVSRPELLQAMSYDIRDQESWDRANSVIYSSGHHFWSFQTASQLPALLYRWIDSF